MLESQTQDTLHQTSLAVPINLMVNNVKFLLLLGTHLWEPRKDTPRLQLPMQYTSLAEQFIWFGQVNPLGNSDNLQNC